MVWVTPSTRLSVSELQEHTTTTTLQSYSCNFNEFNELKLLDDSYTTSRSSCVVNVNIKNNTHLPQEVQGTTNPLLIDLVSPNCPNILNNKLHYKYYYGSFYVTTF